MAFNAIKHWRPECRPVAYQPRSPSSAYKSRFRSRHIDPLPLLPRSHMQSFASKALYSRYSDVLSSPFVATIVDGELSPKVRFSIRFTGELT